MKILTISMDREVSKLSLKEAEKQTNLSVTNFQNRDINTIYDVLYVDMLHMGMDEEFEPVVDAIESGDLKVGKIVFLATAGMDQEIDPSWIEVQNLKELLLEVKYVAKLIDETELPYTILRPVEVKSEVQNSEIELVTEGQPIAENSVTTANVKQVILDAIMSEKYTNQSVGISSRK